MYKCFVIALLALTSLLSGAIEDAPYLLVIQDFLKFGKKEAFEAVSKNFLQDRKMQEKNMAFLPMMTIQETDSAQFLTVVPLNSYADIDAFMKMQQDFTKSMPPEEWAKKVQMFGSTVNFRVNSLHQFKKELSYIPAGQKTTYGDMPYLYYVIYSIQPGTEEAFENYVRTMLEKESSNKTPATNFCWRVWKVNFGGDVPKYVIALFTTAENALEDKKEKIFYKEPSIQEIIRRTQEGKGKVRPDLSYLPEKNVPAETKNNE